MIPTSVLLLSTTGIPEILFDDINLIASEISLSGPIVIGLITIPDSNFFTFLICSDCSSTDIFL